MRLKFAYILAMLLLYFFSKVNAQGFTEKIKNADSLYQLKDYAGAKMLYEEALKDTSTDGRSWNRLGFSYYNLGDMKAAIGAYNKALSNGHSALLKASVYSRMAKDKWIAKQQNSSFG